MLVYGAMRDYVRSAPLHTTQRIECRQDLDEEPLELFLRVKDNHELRNRLASMLGSVVVTAPQQLVDWQQEALRLATERINNPKLSVKR